MGALGVVLARAAIISVLSMCGRDMHACRWRCMIYTCGYCFDEMVEVW